MFLDVAREPHRRKHAGSTLFLPYVLRDEPPPVALREFVTVTTLHSRPLLVGNQRSPMLRRKGTE